MTYPTRSLTRGTNHIQCWLLVFIIPMRFRGVDSSVGGAGRHCLDGWVKALVLLVIPRGLGLQMGCSKSHLHGMTIGGKPQTNKICSTKWETTHCEGVPTNMLMTLSKCLFGFDLAATHGHLGPKQLTNPRPGISTTATGCWRCFFPRFSDMSIRP